MTGRESRSAAEGERRHREPPADERPLRTLSDPGGGMSSVFTEDRWSENGSPKDGCWLKERPLAGDCWLREDPLAVDCWSKKGSSMVAQTGSLSWTS